jgi:hypothetical protein
MLAATRATVSVLNGRDVIVGIAGGTMLSLALTRPQLRWVERLTEDSMTARLWAERALTFFSFVMAGYAATAVLLVLHKQLNAESDALLDGAAWFLMIYAWLVHLEPFSKEWNLSGGICTSILYTGFASSALIVGFSVASLVLTSSVDGGILQLLAKTAGITAFGWLLCRFGPDLMAATQRVLGREPPQPQKPKAPANPSGPLINSADTASVTVTSTPTRTQAHSTRA